MQRTVDICRIRRTCKFWEVQSTANIKPNVNQLIPDLVEEIKTSSTAWIKYKKLSKFQFQWQRGYGAFSHSRSQVEKVVKYILNQEEHHKKCRFKEEYLEMLRKNDVEYDERYLFEFFDGVDGWGD